MVLRRLRSRDETGAVAVLVAVLCTLMFTLAAIVVDLGLARDRRRGAQNAADAAALAAAQYLSRVAAPLSPAAADVEQARQVALSYVTANGWPPGAVVRVDAGQARVTVDLTPEQSPSLFAGITGQSTPVVAATATATWRSGVPDCILCILDTLDTGTGTALVNGGSAFALNITASSGNNGGVQVTGGVVGYANTFRGDGDFSPRPVKVPPIVDPFAYLQLPGQLPAIGPGKAINGAGDCSPGNYVLIEDCDSFAPGIYVVIGDTKLTGKESIVADGVLIYLACADQRDTNHVPRPCGNLAGLPEQGGNLDGAGKGSATLRGPTDGPFRGFAVIADPRNGAVQKWRGNGELTVVGSMYAPAATLDDGGNGKLEATGRVVVGNLNMNGQGKYKYHVNVTADTTFDDFVPAPVHLVDRS